MKNKLTRKLMLSAFTLLFAVISLGASTYAWFTMSEKAEIEAFEAQVKAGEGIEIAVTKESTVGNAQWYTGTVPSDVIQAVTNPKIDGKYNFRFDAISTNNTAASFVKKDMTAAAESGFISFYIHIKTAEAGTVKLNKIALTGDGANWTADAQYNLTKDLVVNVNDSINYNVANAARVAVTEVTPNDDGELVDGSFVIYENDTATPSETDAGNQGGQLCSYEKEVEGTPKTFDLGALAYYNSKISKSEDKLSSSNAASYTTVQVKNLTNAPQEFNPTESSGDIITLHVKVWIEGWDTECLNALFNQMLSVEFGFIFVSNDN